MSEVYFDDQRQAFDGEPLAELLPYDFEYRIIQQSLLYQTNTWLRDKFRGTGCASLD
jgi:hypothetical protein